MSGVIFSGRFDPPHPGHVVSILRLHAKYGHVVVPLLDSPERSWPAQYCKQVMDEIFSSLKGDIEVVINTTHFAKITLEELKSYGPPLYASSNIAVLKHVESLGFPCLYTDRAFEYSASKYVRAPSA